MSENVQICRPCTYLVATRQRADQERDSPYPVWQLEAGFHPREFVVVLFGPVCILFGSGRGKRNSAILARASSDFNAASEAEALCVSNLLTYQNYTAFT